MSAPAKVDTRPGGAGPDAAFSSRGLNPLATLRGDAPLPTQRYEGMLPNRVRTWPEPLRRTVVEIGTAVIQAPLPSVNAATELAVQDGIPHNELLTKYSAIRSDARAEARQGKPGAHQVDPISEFQADAAEQLAWHTVSRQPGFDDLDPSRQLDVMDHVGQHTRAFVERGLLPVEVNSVSQGGTVFERQQGPQLAEPAPEPVRTVVTDQDAARALVAIQRQTRRGSHQVLPAKRTRDEELRLFKMLDGQQDPKRAHLRWTPQELADAF